MTPTLLRRAGAVTIITATAVALAACGGVGAKLTYHETEKVKVTEIDLAGHSGDVAVSTAAIDETRITRVVHRASDPGPSYRIDGTVLHLSTDCGPGCWVSYQIEAPAGVAVAGTLTSGDVTLTRVGSADVEVSSGDLTVTGVSGALKLTSTSGDIRVTGGAGPVTLQATSGDVHAVNLVGGPVSARVTSGDVQISADKPTSVTAAASSGDVQLIVPGGGYQVRARASSGDVRVGAGIRDDPAAKDVLDVHADSGDVTLTAAAA